MKGFSLALLALVSLEASDKASAFLPPNLLRPPHGASFRATSVDMATGSDISVPYDAAARLAYDEWCSTYGKKFDEARYQVFKDNYEAITVMNVSAKKAARDSGDKNPPALLALNEYADYTADEYEAALSGTSAPSTGDVLGQVADAVESQSAASNALQEAADALAEEEERLAAQLGLSSVEELEAAIDSMDGIAPDGGAMEGDNLAREARVRSAYLDWCKEYKKEPDESRFQQFSINFLDMEEFAKESGKEMTLNEYADCTEEEYAALMEGDAAVKEAESAIQAADEEMKTKAKAAEAAATEAAAKKKAAEEAEAKKRAEQEAAAAAAKKAEEEAKKKKEEELKKKKAVEEEKRKLLAEKARLASLSDEERRKEIEQEKSARQAAQDKGLENERLAAASAAIAAAKAAQEAEAARIAKQRAIAEEAAEKLRAQAREWEVKQARLAPKPKVEAPVVQPKKKPAAPTFSLGSLFGSQDATKPPAKTKEAAKAPAPRPTLSLGSFFDYSETKAEVKKPVAKTPAKTSAPAKGPAPRPTLSLDFLTKAAPAPKAAPKPTPVAPPKPTPVAKAPAPAPASRPSLALNFFGTPAPAPAKTPAPKPEPQVELKLKPVPKIETSDPVTEAFSSFFGGKKETAPKPAPKAQSSPAPKPAPVAKPASKPQPESAGFSFFSPKPAPKVEPAPTLAPAPAPKPAPAFSFFSPKPAPKVQPAPEPAPAPAPKPAGFSFFSPKPTPKAEPAPAPAPAPTPAFSFFGGAKAVAPKEAAKVAPAKTQPPARPTLSLFSAPKTAAATKASPVQKTAAKSATPQDNIPVLSRWVQNDDGSITGLVSNSPNFRNGTKITTSPVRKGAKGGSVVRTGSGSQYRLS